MIFTFLPLPVIPNKSSASLRWVREISRYSSHHLKRFSQKGLTLIHFRKKWDRLSTSSQKSHVSSSLIRTCRRYRLHGISLYAVLYAKDCSLVSLVVLYGSRKIEGQSRTGEGVKVVSSPFQLSALEKGRPRAPAHSIYHWRGNNQLLIIKGKYFHFHLSEQIVLIFFQRWWYYNYKRGSQALRHSCPFGKIKNNKKKFPRFGYLLPSYML